MERLLSRQQSHAYCTCSGSHRSRGLSVVAIWNHTGKSIVHPLFSLRGCLFFSGSAFLVFCLLSIPPLCFFFFSLSTVITVQACKLAPDIGHLSGKFEGFDWRILSLTGHFDWALPL